MYKRKSLYLSIRKKSQGHLIQLFIHCINILVNTSIMLWLSIMEINCSVRQPISYSEQYSFIYPTSIGGPDILLWTWNIAMSKTYKTPTFTWHIILRQGRLIHNKISKRYMCQKVLCAVEKNKARKGVRVLEWSWGDVS